MMQGIRERARQGWSRVGAGCVHVQGSEVTKQAQNWRERAGRHAYIRGI